MQILDCEHSTVYTLKMDKKEIVYLLRLAEEVFRQPPDRARGLLNAREEHDLIHRMREVYLQ